MNMDRRKSVARKALLYHLAALSITLMIGLIVYFETYRSMVELWLRSDTFMHGFVILPLSVYLVWRKWPQLKSIPPHSFFPGIFLILLISSGWFVADTLAIQVGKHFAVTAIIPAAVLTVMGVSFARAIAFPLGYLIFAVPFGEFWIPELMEITADLAIVLLKLTGIPVLRDGLFISIPGGNFVVAEACSGIRYLLATLALGTLFAHLNYHKTSKKLIFVAFSIALPIVANGVRAYGIIAIAHYSNMKHAVGIDHIIYGWIFFGVVISLLFLAGSRYRDDEPSDHGSVSISMSDAGAAQPGRLAFIMLTASAAMMFGQLVSQAYATKHMQASVLPNGLPNVVRGRQGTVLLNSDWVPSFIGATQKLLVRYSRDDEQVDVALIRYAGQRQGSELANSSNSITGSNGWRRRNTHTLDIGLANGQSIQLFETIAVRNGVIRRFWYWYEVDGIVVASSIRIKLYEALSLLRGRPAISSAIIVSVIDDGGGPIVLQAFIRDAYNRIGECLVAAKPQKECRLLSLSASSETDPE